ncbi:MAG: S8 family serine peptidase, partial [Phycisphaerae bacterium]
MSPRRAAFMGGMPIILATVVTAAALATVPDRVAPANATGAIRLRTGRVRTLDLDNELDAKGRFDATARYVIQLTGPITSDQHTALIATGAILGDYLPDYAYIARFERTTRRSIADLPFVHWVGRFQNAWKIDPQIGRLGFTTEARQTLRRNGVARLVVVSFDDVDPNAFEAQVTRVAAPINLLSSFGRHHEITVEMPLAQVRRLAALSTVQYVEEAPEFTPRNDAVAWSVQSNASNFIPLWDRGLRGENQIGGIIDTTVKTAHCAFSDVNPIGPTHRKIEALYGTGTPDSHGTHTCGTFVGDAAPTGGDECFNGMAWAARVVIRDLNIVGLNSLLTAYTTHHADGARVHTNSFGNSATNAYNISCVHIDQFMLDNEDDLVVFAIANSTIPSTLTVRNPENAKNLLAVGATREPPNQDQHQSGAIGPTADGRRRPEVFAPGQTTLSANSGGTCGNFNQSGTSMACPAVAGMGILVRQYFMEGFYPSGDRDVADVFTPSGALIKAILINSAVDMTGVPDYPSLREGWGRIQTDDTLFFAGDARKLWLTDKRNTSGLTTGQFDEWTVHVAGGAEPLKITMAFTDVPGTENAAAPVVNDLNLQVTAPGGAVYLGNIFDTSLGESITGGSADPLNSVEQVHLATPAVGAYTIRIDAFNVPAPSMNPMQGYTLVVTGDIAAPADAVFLEPAGTLPDHIQAGSPANVVVRVQGSSEQLVPGSPTLHHRFQSVGGAYTAAAMQALGGDLYTASLPAGTCGDSIEYYFSADGDLGGNVTLPASAPGAVFAAALANRVIVLEDDFESDAGWTVEAGATGGNFERAIPEPMQECGRDTQPGADHSTGACSFCFVTGALAGGGPNAQDVDGGVTRLVSPVLDLSNYTSATVRAYVWFYEGYLPDNEVTIDVSTNGGASWTTAETLEHGRSDWREIEFRVEDAAALTSQFQLRVSADDAGTDSVMEVLIDDVRIVGWSCVVPPTCRKGDMNGDDLVDGEDAQGFIDAFLADCAGLLSIQARCAADFNEDSTLGMDDVSDFVDCLLQPATCP